MNQDVIALASARKAARPDVYKNVSKPAAQKSGYDQSVYDMIEDLRQNVPGISLRQVADFLGISTKPVRKVFDAAKEESEDDFIPLKTNEEMCSDEHAALRATGREGYDEDERSAGEYPAISVVLTAPRFQDSGRKADQSHTLRRPITLPTKPFLPLINRYAA
jgi:hypothetical protein